MSLNPRLLTGRRVLVVEDEYLIAEGLADWLEDAGAKLVGPVPSVEQALAIIETDGVPDAAVLEINLGLGTTVYPVADRLEQAGVPYVFATGNVKAGGTSRYADRPRLEKPVLKRDLLNMIERLLVRAGDRGLA